MEEEIKKLDERLDRIEISLLNLAYAIERADITGCHDEVVRTLEEKDNFD